MIITFIIASVLATIIFVKNREHLPMLWGSAFLFAAGFSVLCSYIDSEFSQVPAVMINSMNFAADCSLAFTFGMFGITYSDLFNRSVRRKVAVAGAIAAAIVLVLTPLASIRNVNYAGYNALPMVCFVFLMLILGAAPMIMAYFKEKHSLKKIERLFTNGLMISTMIWIFVSYLYDMLGIDLWRYNYIAAICFLFVFLILGVSKGVLGLKLSIEQYKADASWHSLKSGASLFNHTVKNEVVKLDLLLHHLKQALHNHTQTGSIDKAGLEDMNELIEAASESVGHVQSMVDRIHNKVQAIRVDLQKSDLLPIVEQCLASLERTFGKHVTVRWENKKVSDVYCDPVHLKEVVHNILMNAAEAIDQEGVITVSLHETRKEVVLRIEDTGKGIPKESLAFIFDPFYSTKKMKNHYGLGLFYCKNVMRKHNGSIHVENLQGGGTRFSVHLPKCIRSIQ